MVGFRIQFFTWIAGQSVHRGVILIFDRMVAFSIFNKLILTILLLFLVQLLDLLHLLFFNLFHLLLHLLLDLFLLKLLVL